MGGGPAAGDGHRDADGGGFELGISPAGAGSTAGTETGGTRKDPVIMERANAIPAKYGSGDIAQT